MVFDLEKFYINEISSLETLNCKYQRLLAVRKDIRDKIKKLDKKKRTAKRSRGHNLKKYNNQVAVNCSGKIGRLKVRRKQLSRRLNDIWKLTKAKERMLDEIF